MANDGSPQTPASFPRLWGVKKPVQVAAQTPFSAAIRAPRGRRGTSAAILKNGCEPSPMPTAAPVLTRVRHHAHAMPQYTVGHLERVAEIERRAAGASGLVLAGAAYRGVGIPDCVRSGEAAGETALRHLAAGGKSVAV